MKKVLIIIPYFGDLPSWFQLFLNSAKSTLVDFLMITDDQTEFIFPENFSIRYYSLNDFTGFFISKAGTDLYLSHPYKFCDYKPLFGKVFQDDLSAYEYWGFSDVDLIFGDIDLFIKPYLETQFDKLFRYGHFSILRNSEQINNLYKSDIVNYNFNFVKNTSLPCHFDEVSFNEIITLKKKTYIQDQPYRNININHLNFAVGDGRPDIPQLIVFDNGKVFVAEETPEGILTTEIFYIHFMRRKDLPVRFDEGNRYIICRDGFVAFKSWEDIQHLFKQYGLPVNLKTNNRYRKLLTKSRWRNKKNAFYKELKAYKFKALYNIIFHYFLHRVWRY